MNIKDKLFYKVDKETGENRISKLKVGLIAIVLILIILFILASFSSTANTETGTYNYGNTDGSSNQLIHPISEAEYKQSCDEISFKKLNKNPDSRIGENYTFTGQAYDVKEENGKTKLQLYVNGIYSMDRIWVTYDGS